MSPARPRPARALLFASLLASVLACAACDTDFSPGWEEQIDALMDAGVRPEPRPEDAAQPDAGTPTPLPDAGAHMPLFVCSREYRCDRLDPGCPALCLVPSALLDQCKPGDCRADGFSPVRCEYCMPEPIK